MQLRLDFTVPSAAELQQAQALGSELLIDRAIIDKGISE